MVVAAVLVSLFLSSQTRAIPDLGEEHQQIELPSDVKNVLSWPSYSEAKVRVPILLYHYVEYVHDKNDTIRQRLNILPSVFTSQIETLKSAGYTFITPTDLAFALAGIVKLPEKLVMLTFDDGYRDFYTDVFPILKKEEVKAVAYIVPNFLSRPNFMFTWQLAEVAKSGLVEIGAHTMDHMTLKGLAKNTARYEVSQSRRVLQEMLKLPINSFAYPYGAFDLPTIQLVQEAGFTNAVSTVPDIIQTRQNEYFLYRLRPGARTGQTLLKYLAKDKFSAW